jgi:hypothetical protein
MNLFAENFRFLLQYTNPELGDRITPHQQQVDNLLSSDSESLVGNESLLHISLPGSDGLPLDS